MSGKKKTPAAKPHSTNHSIILDYPATMSSFEKESLVGEAKLKAAKKKPSKTRKA
jgi:hypothetical protein